MTNQDILMKYKQEKDEGKIFFERRSIQSTFGGLIVIAMVFAIISVMLCDNTVICDSILLILFPVMIVIYSVRFYYLRTKIDLLLSFVWLLVLVIKIVSFIKMIL